LLGDVVIQRRPFYAKKERQRLPVRLHVHDRVTEGRVGLNLVGRKLLVHPGFQILHQRTTVVLMEFQPCSVRQSVLLGLAIERVSTANLSDGRTGAADHVR